MADDNAEKENREAPNIVLKLPSYLNSYKDYQGNINPKIISNLKNQFETDPNTCVIKDAEISSSDSDDSFMSVENPDNDQQTQQQTTLKLRFLMERYKIKEESMLGDALIQDSMKCYINNINKQSIIQKGFIEQSEAIRRERDELSRLSSLNAMSLNLNNSKQQKTFDFEAINRARQEQREAAEESENNREGNHSADGENYSEDKKRAMIAKLKPWQLEINCLNHSSHSEFFKKQSQEEVELKEFREKFRLNKTFEFNLHVAKQKTKGNHKSLNQDNSHSIIADRYQDRIFDRLPGDIDTIQKHVVEYIDLTGQGNLQPQNIVELKGDVSSAVGKTEISQKQNILVLQTKAIYEDYIETFSAVIEDNDGLNLNLLTFQREISPISRQVIKSNGRLKVENQDEADMIKNDVNEINLDDIRDEDIMNIISGRIDPEALNEMILRQERYQNSLLNRDQSFEDEKGESQSDIQDKLIGIKHGFLKKGKVEQEVQACFVEADQLIQLSNTNQETESDTLSMISKSSKRKQSQNQNNLQKPPAQRHRKRSSQIFNNSSTGRSKTTSVPSNGVQSSTTSNNNSNNPNNPNTNSKLLSSKTASQSSSSSVSSRISQKKKDDVFPANEREQYFEDIALLESMETEHNKLIKIILTAQVHPRVHPIYEEVKNLRLFKKKILKTENVNEAVEMTKMLNFHICSKLKEIIMLLFDSPDDSFEIGLEKLMGSLSHINSNENTVEQGRLKIVFMLIQEFRKALAENQMDITGLQQRESNPDFEIIKIQQKLDSFHQKKPTSKQEQSSLDQKLDFGKLSYFNFRQQTPKKSTTEGNGMFDQGLRKKQITNDSIEIPQHSPLNSPEILNGQQQQQLFPGIFKDEQRNSSKNIKSPTQLYQQQTFEGLKPALSELSFTTAIWEESNHGSQYLLNSQQSGRISNNQPRISIQVHSPTQAPRSRKSISLQPRFSFLPQEQFLKNLVTPEIKIIKPSNSQSPLNRAGINYQASSKQSPISGRISSRSPLQNSTKNVKTQLPEKNISVSKNKNSTVNTENKLWNNAIKLTKNAIKKNEAANNACKKIEIIEKPQQSTDLWLENIEELKKQRAQRLKAKNLNVSLHSGTRLDKIQGLIDNYESVLSCRSKSSSSKHFNTKSPEKRAQHSTATTANKFESVSTAFSSSNFSQLTSPRGLFASAKHNQEPKLLNKSANIFEYISKEQSKGEVLKSRKNIYKQGQSSAEIIRKNMTHVMTPTKQLTKPFMA